MQSRHNSQRPQKESTSIAVQISGNSGRTSNKLQKAEHGQM